MFAFSKRETIFFLKNVYEFANKCSPTEFVRIASEILENLDRES